MTGGEMNMIETSNRNLSDVERSVSLAVALFLGLAGVRRSFSASTLTLAGVVFALRGLSGRCPLYRRLGIVDRRAEKARVDECVDATLDDSFPASDPPAWTGGKG
jgi:hypothetical protein